MATDSGVDEARAMRPEVGAGHGAAGGLEVGGDLERDVAAVEVGEAGAGKMLERVGQPLRLEPRADLGNLAVDQVVGGEAVGRRQLVEVLRGKRIEGVRDRDAFPPERDRAGDQVLPRDAAAERGGDLVPPSPTPKPRRRR